jgi:hypothetical protein
MPSWKQWVMLMGIGWFGYLSHASEALAVPPAIVQFTFNNTWMTGAHNIIQPDTTGPLQVNNDQWSTEHRGLYWNGNTSTSLGLPSSVAQLCSAGFSLELEVKIDQVGGSGMIMEWSHVATSLSLQWSDGQLYAQLANGSSNSTVALPLHLPVNYVVLTSVGDLWVNGQNASWAPLVTWLQGASWWHIGTPAPATSSITRQYATRMSGSGGFANPINATNQLSNEAMAGDTTATDNNQAGWWLLGLALFNYSMSSHQVGTRYEAMRQEFVPLVCLSPNATTIVVHKAVDTDPTAVWMTVFTIRAMWPVFAPLWPTDWRLLALGPGKWTMHNHTLQPLTWLSIDDEWQWRGNTTRSFVAIQGAGATDVCRVSLGTTAINRNRFSSILPVADIWWLLGILSTTVVATMLYLWYHHHSDRLVHRLLFKGASLHAIGVSLGFIVVDNLYYRDLLDENEAQAWYSSFAVMYLLEAIYELSAYMYGGWVRRHYTTASHHGVTLVRCMAEFGNLLGATVYVNINFIHGISTREYTEWEIMGMVGYGSSGLGYLMLTVYEHYHNNWLGVAWEAEMGADLFNTVACWVYTAVLFQQLDGGHRNKREFQRLVFSSGYLFVVSALCYVYGSFR